MDATTAAFPHPFPILHTVSNQARSPIHLFHHRATGINAKVALFALQLNPVANINAHGTGDNTTKTVNAITATRPILTLLMFAAGLAPLSVVAHGEGLIVSHRRLDSRPGAHISAYLLPHQARQGIGRERQDTNEKIGTRRRLASEQIAHHGRCIVKVQHPRPAGGRRDEEKARAKERVFSFRTAAHRWDPKNQRPELWNLYNAKKNKDESIRVFPISNWTELDIWQYIALEKIDIVPLYMSQKRPTVTRDGLILVVDDNRFRFEEGEEVVERSVRFRTLGCYPLTGATESEATDMNQIGRASCRERV